MAPKAEVNPAHPLGELETTGNLGAGTIGSRDTFAGKVQVKWAPEATVSSLGPMPYFIEFLKTGGLLDKWVEECPLAVHERECAGEAKRVGDAGAVCAAGPLAVCAQQRDPGRRDQSWITGKEQGGE